VSLREGPAGPEVIVRLESDEPTVFARLAPGGYGTTAIRVTASATFVIF
jgi:hypothetical protein